MPVRFPTLRAAFLEGGVSWAAQLYADACSHFAKRNRDALAHYDARRLDRSVLRQLVAEHGEPAVSARVDRLDEGLTFLSDPDEPDADLDEWAHSGVTSAADLARIFADQWFFGCEADDPMNALAFDRHAHPDGIAMRAMFASDIGHWDVPDFLDVLHEAWELVEDGRVDARQFRAFTCDNVIDLLGADFFTGTVLEDYVNARQ